MRKRSLTLDDKLDKIASSGETPKLLLHSCCAPCSSYVLEYLSRFFEITALYYNPNIYPREEFDKRWSELSKLMALAEYTHHVKTVICEYDSERFERVAAPYQTEPEGGQRCTVCYQLRLEETAKRAQIESYDYFSTTLSVSPHKDAALLNELGSRLAEQYAVNYLYADFKKKDGYKRSIQLSNQFGLYRQTYCGCRYSYRTASDG